MQELTNLDSCWGEDEDEAGILKFTPEEECLEIDPKSLITGPRFDPEIYIQRNGFEKLKFTKVQNFSQEPTKYPDVIKFDECGDPTKLREYKKLDHSEHKIAETGTLKKKSKEALINLESNIFIHPKNPNVRYVFAQGEAKGEKERIDDLIIRIESKNGIYNKSILSRNYVELKAAIEKDLNDIANIEKTQNQEKEFKKLKERGLEYLQQMNVTLKGRQSSLAKNTPENLVCKLSDKDRDESQKAVDQKINILKELYQAVDLFFHTLIDQKNFKYNLSKEAKDILIKPEQTDEKKGLDKIRSKFEFVKLQSSEIHNDKTPAKEINTLYKKSLKEDGGNIESNDRQNDNDNNINELLINEIEVSLPEAESHLCNIFLKTGLQLNLTDKGARKKLGEKILEFQELINKDLKILGKEPIRGREDLYCLLQTIEKAQEEKINFKETSV